MSSLGYARDSMLNLLGETGGGANNKTALDNNPMLPKEEGVTAEILLVQSNSSNLLSLSQQGRGVDQVVKKRKQQKRRSTNNSKRTSHAQYSGFAVDYADYEKNGGLSYKHNNNEVLHLLGGKTKKKDGLLCCIFPWTAGSKNTTAREKQNNDDDDDKDGIKSRKRTIETSAAGENADHSPPLSLKLQDSSNTASNENGNPKEEESERILNIEAAEAVVKNDNNDGDSTYTNAIDDDISLTGSEAYGEKLTENERAAVLARLRLASPEIATPPPLASTPAPKTSDQYSNGSGNSMTNNYDSSNINRRKGLLDNLDNVSGVEEFKDAVEEFKDAVEDLAVTVDKKETDTSLSASETDTVPPKKKLKSIMRRGGSSEAMKTKNSRNDGDSMSISSTNSGKDQRRSLFPQQRHYAKGVSKTEDKSVVFASMARVVTIQSKKDMSDLEKSHVWWQKNDYEDFKTTGRLIAKAICQGGSEIWLASNNAWQNNLNRNKQQTTNGSNKMSISSSIIDKKSLTGDKWWHKFGHSRRGLEHIATSEEGRERQMTLQSAIRVVTEEQRRQKMYRRVDPEKLRRLSLQYTTWARDLALAAAASDAEAVRVEFDENRHSREFYLLKHSIKRKDSSKNETSSMPMAQVPSFMSPRIMTLTKNSRILDHNTSSQISFRRRIRQQPVQDPKKKDMAKKASGFGTGDADVSRILSGMGADNSIPSAMGRSQPTSVGAH